VPGLREPKTQLIFLGKFSEKCLNIPTHLLCHVDHTWLLKGYGEPEVWIQRAGPASCRVFRQLVCSWVYEACTAMENMCIWNLALMISVLPLSECLILVHVVCLMHIWYILFWLIMLHEIMQKTWQKEGMDFIWKVRSPELHFICTKLVITYKLCSSFLPPLPMYFFFCTLTVWHMIKHSVLSVADTDSHC
jgi:hypothetical protein